MKKARGHFSDSFECMSVSYCMLTVVIWWCLYCYLLIIYCIIFYKSFCFWWWNRNEKQKYNTDINICTNKSGPFIHETEHARYIPWADPGFQVRRGALKKIAQSGGRHEHFWGISCEKSRFYPKKIIFFPILGGGRPPPPWIRPWL
jgi:hypothetical protein